MPRKRLTVLAGVLASAAVFGVVLLAPGPASAEDGHLGFVCNGAGTLRIDDGLAPLWTVDGSGRCDDLALSSNSEPRTIQFHGTGTSDPFTCTPGLNPSIITTNLVLHVTVTYTGVASGTVVTQNQTWSGPITLNRLVTPTLITSPGIGGSVTFHRIFLACGNDGLKPSASYDWLTLGDS